jgi:D-serine dehydratase
VKVTRLIRKLINQRANALAQTEQSTWVGRMIEEVADGRLRIEDIQRWRP